MLAYDPRAVKHRYEGDGDALRVIGVDGRADNIVVIKTLPMV